MTKILKAGVIGLGVGEQHASSYLAVPCVELRAICDVDPQKLKEVGDRLGISRRYEDWRRITEDPDIDVISICSHDDAHAAQAVSAFRSGKHVMVEKPIALYRKDAEQVLMAQQDSKRFITSNLILRRSPRFIELRKRIAAGEFGDVFYMEGDYVHDILWKLTRGWRGKMDFYSVILGGGIHLIDLLRWLIEREVEEIAGMGNKILTRNSNYRYDDTTVNLLRFEGGILAKVFSSFGPQRTKFHALNVYGSKRTFINDMPDAKDFGGDQDENERRVTTAYPGMEKGDLLPDFIAAIRESREPNVSAKDVFRVMDVCLAAIESTQTGRTVRVSYMI
jgi:UDP-N-acetyl-2-amino-2-deoxyglucuronate dehydrogenase